MQLSDFDYILPKELIALYPAANRDEARLMVVDRQKKTISHHVFQELAEILPHPGLLVRNNTKVRPARLRGFKNPQGGQVEVLLLKEVAQNLFEAMVKPARRLKTGQQLYFSGNSAEIVQQLEEGKRLIKFNTPASQLEKLAEIPLPPYIQRDVASSDAERYQTIYAQHSGSVAAPTAGLHFTEKVLTSLQAEGVEIIDVTLHVGPGTFKPVKCAAIEEHKMDFEEYITGAETYQKIKNDVSPLTAVGTTSVRVIETICQQETAPLSGKTNIFIYPGYRFRRVNHLLTNFHLPCSTLLMLVAAFAGLELTKEAYQIAIAEKYRFYSYGDAMLIL